MLLRLRAKADEETAMTYWYGSGMSGWGYALMTISMVLFWVLVIGGVVALIRYFGRAGQRGDAGTGPSTPGQLLAQRFARGEIDEDEYRRRLEVLQASGRTLAKS
jgi:putative membrane protein